MNRFDPATMTDDELDVEEMNCLSNICFWEQEVSSEANIGLRNARAILKIIKLENQKRHRKGVTE